MTWTLSLPWPPPSLWPNRNAHQMVLHRARKPRKAFAYWAARDAGLWKLRSVEGLRLTVTFHRRSAGVYDLDGALSAMKADLDGIALAAEVDDSLFQLEPIKGEPFPPHGKVVVSIEAIA